MCPISYSSIFRTKHLVNQQQKDGYKSYSKGNKKKMVTLAYVCHPLVLPAQNPERVDLRLWPALQQKHFAC